MCNDLASRWFTEQSVPQWSIPAVPRVIHENACECCASGQALSALHPPYQRTPSPFSPLCSSLRWPSDVFLSIPVNHSVPVTGVDEAVMSANPGRKFGDCLMEVDSGAGWVHAVAWSPSGQLPPREQVSLAALRCSN